MLTLSEPKMSRWSGRYCLCIIFRTSSTPGSGHSNEWKSMQRPTKGSRASQWECCCKSDRSPAAAPAKVTGDRSPPLQSPAISPSFLLLHPTHTPPPSRCRVSAAPTKIEPCGGQVTVNASITSPKLTQQRIIFWSVWSACLKVNFGHEKGNCWINEVLMKGLAEVPFGLLSSTQNRIDEGVLWLCATWRLEGNWRGEHKDWLNA